MPPPSPSLDPKASAQEVCRPNPVKNLMHSNKLAYAFGLRIAFSTEMPLIAKRAGYSALLMNMEHMAIGMETVRDVAVGCLSVGIAPAVVVPTCSPEWISRCLDSGAQIVIVPHVNNASQARTCVSASKFPPLGHRSVTMISPLLQYETRLSYSCIADVVNDTVMIMPMIETIEGVEHVEAIAAVPGLDALFIGCADLTMELGIQGQYDAELFRTTVDRIAAAAEKAGVFVGVGGLEPRLDVLEALARRHRCMRFAMAGRDIALLMSAMNKHVAAMEQISASLSA